MTYDDDGPLKLLCPRCLRDTDAAEIIQTPLLGWCCLRCVEDARLELEGR
jgi:hypothetical protein